MPLNFLERLALVEKKGEFIRGERFEGEKIAEFRCHILTQRKDQNAFTGCSQLTLRSFGYPRRITWG
jgi:hypothetical protein